MAENPLKAELLLFGKKLREVPVPEVSGLSIYVRNVTIGERLAHQQAHGREGLTGQDIILLCCFDEMGRPFFDSSDEVGHLDQRIASRLLTAIMDESGVSAAKEADAEKKSESSQS